MTSKKHLKVESRKDNFSQKLSTKIWYEEPSEKNEFVSSQHFCHGYNLFELMSKKSYSEVLFLLFQGELPTSSQKKLFERLIIFTINPGLRNASCRASVCAGVGKTDLLHILPIGLTTFSGETEGAGYVSQCMQSLRKLVKNSPELTADEALVNFNFDSMDSENHIIPGFGQLYGTKDEFIENAITQFEVDSIEMPYLDWSKKFLYKCRDSNIGFLKSGLIAAILLECGFNHKLGSAIYQLISAPGMLAHGFEMSSKPLTAMPFIDDSMYEIINNAEK